MADEITMQSIQEENSGTNNNDGACEREQTNQKGFEVVPNYMQMKEEWEENSLRLLGFLKTIQEKVDKTQRRSKVAIVGGCITSLLGGAMITGGIITVSFMLSVGIALAVVGIVVATGGCVTTTIAGFFFGATDNHIKKGNKMVIEYLERYKAAKDASKIVSWVCLYNVCVHACVCVCTLLKFKCCGNTYGCPLACLKTIP